MTLKVFSKQSDPVLMSVLMTPSVSISRGFSASQKQPQRPQGLGLNFLGSDFPACTNGEDRIVCLGERCDSEGQMPSHCPCDNRSCINTFDLLEEGLAAGRDGPSNPAEMGSAQKSTDWDLWDVL